MTDQEMTGVRLALNNLAKATRTTRWDKATADIFEETLLKKFNHHEKIICQVLYDRREKDAEMPKLPHLIGHIKNALPRAHISDDEKEIRQIKSDWVNASLPDKARWLMARFEFHWKRKNDFREMPEEVEMEWYSKYLGQLYAIDDEMSGKSEEQKRAIWLRYFPRFEMGEPGPERGSYRIKDVIRDGSKAVPRQTFAEKSIPKGDN